MTESSLEELIQERQFAGLLQRHAEVFFRLTNTLLGAKSHTWNKKHYFQLISEAEALESFLDDYGARYNETYAFLTELVASVRGFAQTGHCVAHMTGRLESYGAGGWFTPSELAEAEESTHCITSFVRNCLVVMLDAIRVEAQTHGVEITPATFPESNFLPAGARRKLPRNLGQSEPIQEEQKIAEVVAKYLQACELMAELGVRQIVDPEERRRFLARVCTEEQARVYEATVHNLQSTYDTHIQNTVLEAGDARLQDIRGHASAALHLLGAVTHLVHFIERHEDEIRSEEAKRRISELIDRAQVQDIVLNHMLLWAERYLRTGSAVAEALLPEYTNVQSMEVEILDGMSVHARPASLIVSVVNQYGTPVEMEVGGKRCDAGSILELLVAVGSHPDIRTYTFRGDERPLRDIRLLFEHGLGEEGLDSLPEELDYLRHGFGESS